MDVFRDLRTIYLSLEEAEVIRDMGDDWSTQDTDEFGIDFENLLILREFVLKQDYVTNLGYRNLLHTLFPPHCRELLNESEKEIWNSIEQNLDFSNFALGMEYLVTRNTDSLRETIVEDFLLEELSGFGSGKELKRQVTQHFNVWIQGDGPTLLVESLPGLASAELAMLHRLRG